MSDLCDKDYEFPCCLSGRERLLELNKVGVALMDIKDYIDKMNFIVSAKYTNRDITSDYLKNLELRLSDCYVQFSNIYQRLLPLKNGINLNKEIKWISVKDELPKLNQKVKVKYIHSRGLEPPFNDLIKESIAIFIKGNLVSYIGGHPVLVFSEEINTNNYLDVVEWAEL